MRGRGLRRAAAVTLVIAAGACVQPPPPAPLHPVDVRLRAFLPAPAEALGRDVLSPWPELHARLLSGEASSRLAPEIEAAAREGEQDPGHLLRAELLLSAGDASAAFGELQRLSIAARERPLVRLLEARTREGASDLQGAYTLYFDLAGWSPVAAERARALEAPVVGEVRSRLEGALARGRLVEARRELDRLRAWRPSDVATLRSAVAVANAEGNRTGELAAWRALAMEGALDETDLVRRATLELQVGDAEVALAELEKLAHRHPERADIADELDRARFGWRLSHTPEPVQRAAAAAVLTRGQLAELLYWLVPGVRAGRGGVPRIASDVVGHEARDEIVRVVNLGLLAVDEALHRFEPDRAVRRADALAAVLRAVALDGPLPPCASADLAAGWTREGVCSGAAACGLLPSAADCLPGGELSGRDAVEWIRRILAASGRTR